MTESLTLLAPAKINWTLAVLGKRSDGYHELSSLMQQVSLGDTVILSKADTSKCCCLPEPCPSQDNLALKAWLLLKKRFAIAQGLHIMIKKQIPAGGGLAGGSADAAAVMRGVNQMFALGLSLPQLQELGFELGADIPFCLAGGLAQVGGAGEKVYPCQERIEKELLLICPGIALATKDVFAAFDELPGRDLLPDLGALAKDIAGGSRAQIADGIINMLEPAAFKLSPQIKIIKQKLLSFGCISLMSGSGSSIWALPPEDETALRQLKEYLDKEKINWRLVRTLNNGELL